MDLKGVINISNQKEIGGYFELEEFSGNHYHRDCIKLNTARNSLIHYLKLMNIKKIYLPYFLCDTVRMACKKNGVEYLFYRINSEWLPEDNFILDSDAYILLVNYYGQISHDSIEFLLNKYNRVIIDNTQAFFQKQYMNVPTIYSCRKFLGVPDGSYLCADITCDENLITDRSFNRITHLVGRYEYNASLYYDEFKNVDSSFVDEEVKRMSRFTNNILKAIDYDEIIAKRNANYQVLKQALDHSNKLNLKDNIGPFAYPYYSSIGMILKKELAKLNIYIPTLWPDLPAETPNDALGMDLSSNILPLPCDQRYDGADMSRIINAIKEIEGKYGK